MGESLSEHNIFPQVGDLCYHYKHDASNLLDHVYQVICFAKQTETDEELVIYKALYDTKDILFVSQEKLEYFARPYNMFMEQVEVNGHMIPRFSKIVDRNTLFSIRKALIG